MPTFDAKFLDSDPDGAALLASVLETGRRGRRRTIGAFMAMRDERPAEAAPPILVDRDDRDEEMHPAVFASMAE